MLRPKMWLNHKPYKSRRDRQVPTPQADIMQSSLVAANGYGYAMLHLTQSIVSITKSISMKFICYSKLN